MTKKDFIIPGFDDEGIVDTIRTKSLQKAVAIHTKSNGGYLSEVNLKGADLKGLKIREVELDQVSFAEADLTEATFKNCSFEDVDMTGAKLKGMQIVISKRSDYISSIGCKTIDVSEVNPEDFKTIKDDSCGANFDHITEEQLRNLPLPGVKENFFKIISQAKDDIPFLRNVLQKGEVHGQVYGEGDGKCACLIGTIANAEEIDPDRLPIKKGLDINLAERFFMGIEIGDDPTNSPRVRMVLEWIDEYEELWGLEEIRQARTTKDIAEVFFKKDMEYKRGNDICIANSWQTNVYGISIHQLTKLFLTPALNDHVIFRNRESGDLYQAYGTGKKLNKYGIVCISHRSAPELFRSMKDVKQAIMEFITEKDSD